MSKQPRKQRKQRAEEPLHKRHKRVRATLSSDLRDEFDARSAQVNEGDDVEVMRGDFAGEEGEVLDVDLKDATVAVEDVTVEKADGEETPRRLDASNLKITGLDRSDDERVARLEGDE